MGKSKSTEGGGGEEEEEDLDPSTRKFFFFMVWGEGKEEGGKPSLWPCHIFNLTSFHLYPPLPLPLPPLLAVTSSLISIPKNMGD